MGGGSADVGDLSALPQTPGISAPLSKGWEGPKHKVAALQPAARARAEGTVGYR